MPQMLGASPAVDASSAASGMAPNDAILLGLVVAGCLSDVLRQPPLPVSLVIPCTGDSPSKKTVISLRHRRLEASVFLSLRSYRGIFTIFLNLQSSIFLT